MIRRKKAFTLIELLIVIVIIGILSVILLRTYTWITQMTFRVQQTKNVQQEVLHITQVLQNFADRNTVDFTQYTGLATTAGITDTLYLSGQDGALRFFTSGDCSQTVIQDQLVITGFCALMLEQSGQILQITDAHKAVLGNVVFKIIPFASTEDYLHSVVPCTNNDYLHCLNTPGFRLLLDAYSINYGTQWTNHVHIPLQLFF